ncbi:hypothetical protein COBT_003145, partial [Conglomerata obtusa]
MSPVKPLLRGRFHQFAFYTTIFLTCTYFALAIFSHLPFRLPILIYLISQLTSYGVSATYHLFNFKTTRTKRLFQQLDHASIFLLISGTQTCVITTFIPISIASNLLIVSWTITLIGIFKVIFLNVREVVDVIFYICHGVCIIPFVKKMALYLGTVQWIFIITGGVLYIIGGIVFGAEKPNPWPKVVGYHEIFHVLTIIANYCFMIPVV